MNRLTVVVSFFNVEKYILNCINQLRNQTNSNFNVIFVDDGSTDNGYALCKSEIEGISNFNLIQHESNKGLGAGRITGIINAKTDYVTFMDPDDELDENSIQLMLDEIDGHDLIVFNYYKKSLSGKIDLVEDKSKNMDELFENSSPLIPHVWHKVFKKNIFENVDFDFYSQITFAEDLYLSSVCFANSSTLKIVDKAYYYYIYNEQSLVHNKNEKYIFQNIDVLKELLKNNKMKEQKSIYSYLLRDSFDTFGQLIFPNLTNDFQNKCPHFDEWLKIDNENQIFIPDTVNFIIKFYIKRIRSRNFFSAKVLWFLLKLKKGISNVF